MYLSPTHGKLQQSLNSCNPLGLRVRYTHVWFFDSYIICFLFHILWVNFGFVGIEVCEIERAGGPKKTQFLQGLQSAVLESHMLTFRWIGCPLFFNVNTLWSRTCGWQKFLQKRNRLSEYLEGVDLDRRILRPRKRNKYNSYLRLSIRQGVQVQRLNCWVRTGWSTFCRRCHTLDSTRACRKSGGTLITKFE